MRRMDDKNLFLATVNPPYVFQININLLAHWNPLLCLCLSILHKIYKYILV